jgi:hypothetical protein
MPCSIQIDAPANDPCAFQSAVIGKQLVGILYQEMSGTAPAVMTTLSGIQAGMTATAESQVFIIKNLAASSTPAPTDQTLSGNDVPYGGEIITDRTSKVEVQMQYLTPADIATNNTLAQSQSPKRVWLIDDKNVLQGPIENAYITVGGYIRSGANSATPNRQSLTVTYRGLATPAVGLPIAGVAGLVNA